MTIGVLKESGDQRVALIPENVAALLKLNVEKILVEKDAGATAFYLDADYTAQGAEVADRGTVISGSDVILMVTPADDLASIPSDKILIGGLNPLMNKEVVQQLASQKTTSFSLEVIPRTTRAQAMDILSSMATVAGYKAVLTAASNLPGFFPMFMTAAGSITPSKVLIMGAGVAGLQAIATAKRLGAVVHAFDVRAAAKEEVFSLSLIHI